MKTADRGYGLAHRRLREQLRPVVEAGLAVCCRCGLPIDSDDPHWAVDHDDWDRTIYQDGPRALAFIVAAT